MATENITGDFLHNINNLISNGKILGFSVAGVVVLILKKLWNCYWYFQKPKIHFFNKGRKTSQLTPQISINNRSSKIYNIRSIKLHYEVRYHNKISPKKKNNWKIKDGSNNACAFPVILGAKKDLLFDMPTISPSGISIGYIEDIEERNKNSKIVKVDVEIHFQDEIWKYENIDWLNNPYLKKPLIEKTT